MLILGNGICYDTVGRLVPKVKKRSEVKVMTLNFYTENQVN